MAMASRPSESGMLASVEARCTCAVLPSCASTARITFRSRASGASSPAGRFPISTTSLCTTCGRRVRVLSRGPILQCHRLLQARRSARSSRSISAIEVERRSTLMLADSGIEFTEVPPRITPTLNVVFGEAGTGV